MKVTIEFDNETAANNFMVWWTDGGEQDLGYNTTVLDLDKHYLRVKGSGVLDE